MSQIYNQSILPNNKTTDFSNDFTIVMANNPKQQPASNTPKTKPPATIPFFPNELTPPQHKITYSYNTRFQNNLDNKNFVQFLANVYNPRTQIMENYHKLIQDEHLSTRFQASMCKELGRLAQGYLNIVKGTNTFQFLYQEEINWIPNDKKQSRMRRLLSISAHKNRIQTG